MALTKASYSLIQGAPINVFDYMSAVQIVDVVANTATLDVTTPCQDAINACVAAGGGQVFFPQGTYLLNGVTGADGVVHGLLVPFTSLAIEGGSKSINLIGTGRDCILKAGTPNMYIVRFSNAQSSMQNFQFLGDTSTVGLGLVAENVNSTTLGAVDQSHNVFSNLFFYRNRDGILLKCSKSAGSGCYYNSFSNIYIVYQQNAIASGMRGRGIYLDYEVTDFSPCNRNYFSFITFVRLNTGVQIAEGDTNTFISCSFEDMTQGTLPQPIPTAIVVNLSAFADFNRFIGCTIEAATQALYCGNIRTEFISCQFGTGTQTYPSGPPEYVVGGPPANMGFSTPAIKFNLSGFASLETRVGGTDTALMLLQGDPVRIKATGATIAEFNTTNISFAKSILPTVDNSFNVGSASFRWGTIFAATGAINTSDENEKTNIVDLSEAERQVAITIKGLIKSFKFKDAIKEKGDKARIHFGVIAQEVGNAFRAENLNPEDYAMFCYDEWEDKYEPEIKIRLKLDDNNNPILDKDGNEISETYYTGEQLLVKPAGNRYGIRYDELLAFVICVL
jgi:hypothetical protein